MVNLVLIRHAQVAVDPNQPSESWLLSVAGARDAATLRDDPDVAAVTRFFTSPEPKAQATSRAVADERPVAVVHDLRELDRRALGWVRTPDEYRAVVTEIFAHPDDSYRGAETAASSQRRIVNAIARIVHDNPTETVAAVSHGIVLTLYLAWLRDDLFADLSLWKRMQFPDVAVVDPIERRVIRDF